MLRGVDLNHWKGNVDVSAIACDFVITKATGGIGYVDDQCDRNVQQAIALGKPFGVYHYFSDGFNDGDPIAEANWFVDNCLGYIGKGILILDWERGGNPDVTNAAKALQWLQHVEARTGVKPIIYMSLSLVTGLDWSAVIAGNYGLWVAAYVDDTTPIPNYQMDPNRDPNPHWDGNVNDVLWQFTSTGRLNGYGGNLDCNFFYGTRASWDAYAGIHTSSPTPAPEPTTTTTTMAPEPTPEPTTTTTTTLVAELPPEPDTTTTTTVAEAAQPGTSTTTTTTVAETPRNPAINGWALIVAFFIGLINRMRGVR